MPIELQEMVYGSPNQQFIYLEEEQKIVSLLCPTFAIAIPDGDCNSTAGLCLSDSAQSNGMNQWSFNEDTSIIESVMCAGKFITIDGASSGTRRMAPVQLVSDDWELLRT